MREPEFSYALRYVFSLFEIMNPIEQRELLEALQIKAGIMPDPAQTDRQSMD